jgi:hypothetical protein
MDTREFINGCFQERQTKQMDYSESSKSDETLERIGERK